MAFPREELVEYCLYLLEDALVRSSNSPAVAPRPLTGLSCQSINPCFYCRRDDLPCTMYSWLRCCHYCERRLISDCPMNNISEWRKFAERYRNDIILGTSLYQRWLSLAHLALRFPVRS